MLYKTAARHASELRMLLRQGAFASLSVPLGKGGSLPAEMYARVVLDELDHLSALERRRLLRRPMATRHR